MSGLRERKARQARYAIFDAMLTLCEEQGYGATTIEQVAARAEMGVATVYRYFTIKDAILLMPLADHVGALADAFSARPGSENPRESLAYAIDAALTSTEAQRTQTRRLRAQLDQSPGPRARLWDLWHQEQVLLERAIIARGSPGADPLWAATAARIAALVMQMALDHERSDGDHVDARTYARQVLRLLHGADAAMPASSP